MKKYYFTFAKTASYMRSISQDVSNFFPKEFVRLKVKVKEGADFEKVVKKLEEYYGQTDPTYTWICIGVIPLED